MSNIEWTGKTWNPTVGCSRKSDGCINCYAETLTRRLAAMGQTKYQGLLNEQNRFNGTVRLSESDLDLPLNVKKPTTWFVNSMSDLFHENMDYAWIDKVFQTMGAADDRGLGHEFQVLTKRSEQMLDYMRSGRAYKAWNGPRLATEAFPPRNIWVGVSVENQREKHRIDDLRKTPAAIRFVSFEPLLEGLGTLDLTGIDWAILGGESGPGSRSCDLEWMRAIKRQCDSFGTKVFVKQTGSKPFSDSLPVQITSRKGGLLIDLPKDLQVREFPMSEAAQ